jgi:hypothetical protein
MRLSSVILAVILTSGATAALAQDPSTTGRGGSAEVDAPPAGLPVSVRRIREALASTLERPSLLDDLPTPDDTPRFRISVQEGLPLGAFFTPDDFKVAPAPGGGVYGYEQQRLLNPSSSRPLGQPYAAFNGGQLITVALENLFAKYVGLPLIAQATESQRAAAQAAARAAVERDIAEYCASLMRAGQRPTFCDPAARQAASSPPPDGGSVTR